MPKGVPALKPRQLIRILTAAGCTLYREGKGDHQLYMRMTNGQKRIVPIDLGAGELSPPYVLRIFRQFGFSDAEIEEMIR